MFLTHAKTLLVRATKGVFDQDYPEADFRGLWVSMEYPAEEANYPGIWVGFTPTAPLQVAGIGHREYTDPAADGTVRALTKWRFAGVATFTIAALTSLERDRLLDAMVQVIAFGLDNPATAEFKQTLDLNDLIGVQMNWDQFQITGLDENQGTPWGTDEVIYEGTVGVDCQGEFASSATSGTLVPLSGITVAEYAPGEEPPDLGQDVAQPADTDWQ